MKTFASAFLILYLISGAALPILAQITEPDFVGEVYFLKPDQSYVQLDKEIGGFTSRVSLAYNTDDVLSLDVVGSKAQTRFAAADALNFVVRAVDNNSEPLSIISIYKFKSKNKIRTVMISDDNSGSLVISPANSKNLIRFTGKKFGTSSYLITLKGLEVGEYGIVVSNPNDRDEKRVIVSCFGVDS